ncbi:MAG: hypothetical protein H6553_05800 [Chitinophagales bacterium]|nr:hypothetical protein [Chitinophagales bacterium]
MSDYQDNNEQQVQEQEKKGGINKLLLLLLALLLGGLIFTVLKLKKSNDTIVVNEQKITEVEAAKNDLDMKFNAALADIESYKAENAGLDSLLNVKENELYAKKQKIESLLAQVAMSKNKDSKALKEAQALIAELQQEKENLRTTLDSLMQVNQKLFDDNVTLNNDLTTTKEDRDKISAEKLKIEELKQQMQNRIDEASILTAANFSITPVKNNKKGEEVEVKKAKDASKLKVCFDLLQNKIAPKGATELKVRLLGPDGSTIQIASLGSGTLTDINTGKSIPYTYSITPKFDGDTKQVCSYWNQNYNFSAGKYATEVYQEGVMIGKSSFTLK